MSVIYCIVIIFIIAWMLAYFRARLIVWTATFAAILAVHTMLIGASVSVLMSWFFFLLIALPLNLTPARRVLFSDRILPLMKKAMPSISQTERDALEAGTVWWDAELFRGKPRWRKLLATPAPALSKEEQDFIDGPVNQLCAMVDDWKITHEDADLPPEVWQFIKDKGFFGMIIPKEYGGLAFSAQAHSEVVARIASRSTTAAVTVMVPNSLGPAELLLRYGTKEQKNHYLPRLAKGEEVPCFALTGPEAGSDASAIPDTGIVCRGEFEGQQDVLGIRLNWDKRYITLGPVATVLGLAFKLYDPDRLIGDKEEIGITLALIPTNTPGITIGQRHAPLNLAFQNGPNSGKDVFIPIDWIIGGQQRAGSGWRMLMECLAAGRSISLPALSTGGGKLACHATGAYARIRKQFRMPIGRFEGIEEPLARIAAYTYQMDAARKMTAVAVDQGEHPSVISAIVKYNLTTRMRSVINDAMDIQGGSGICLGPGNILGRIYQAIPIGITVEGANILTRSLITYGQGAIRCHPYILREIQALQEPDPVLSAAEFDRALFGHIGFIISNVARALFLGLTKGFLVVTPAGKERRYYRHLMRTSASFALTSDISLLVLGGALKRREKLSGRLADVLSQMYLVSACLKHFRDQGSKPADLPLLQWACEDAFYQAQTHLFDLYRNFPVRPVAWILKWLCFPTGRCFSPPDDRLGHKLAELLLEPCSARERLTAGVYLPENESDTLARLDSALSMVIKAEPVERKISAAQREGKLDKNVASFEKADFIRRAIDAGIITQDEATILDNAERARRDVIAVDAFDADYLSR